MDLITLISKEEKEFNHNNSIIYGLNCMNKYFLFLDNGIKGKLIVHKIIDNKIGDKAQEFDNIKEAKGLLEFKESILAYNNKKIYKFKFENDRLCSKETIKVSNDNSTKIQNILSNNNQLIVVTDNYIINYNEYFQKNNSKEHNHTIHSVAINDHYLFIGTEADIIVYNIKTMEIEKKITDINKNIINNLFINNNKLYVTSRYTNGLSIIDLLNNFEITHIDFDYCINKITVLSESILILISYNNIYFFDINNLKRYILSINKINSYYTNYIQLLNNNMIILGSAYGYHVYNISLNLSNNNNNNKLNSKESQKDILIQKLIKENINLKEENSNLTENIKMLRRLNLKMLNN